VISVGNGYAAKGPHGTSGEEQNVVDTINVLLDALRDEDLAKFHSVVSPGFYIFDNGVRFDGDAVFNIIKSLHASGKHFEWNVTKPDVHLQGGYAWIAYVNDGMINDGDVKSQQRWLESAFLEKRSGTWKIEFVQSTRVQPSPQHSK
jgi:hypothetical protein